MRYTIRRRNVVKARIRGIGAAVATLDKLQRARPSGRYTIEYTKGASANAFRIVQEDEVEVDYIPPRLLDIYDHPGRLGLGATPAEKDDYHARWEENNRRRREAEEPVLEALKGRIK